MKEELGNQKNSDTESCLVQLLEEVKQMNKRAKLREKRETGEAEWIYLALVLDRIFLILFITVSCITSAVILSEGSSTSDP